MLQEGIKLGMSLDLDDPTIISRYGISNVRAAVSNLGRPFKQFSFGPSMFETNDMHISEGVVVNGLVDALMKTWSLSYHSEKEMHMSFEWMSKMFGRLYDQHMQELSKKTKFIAQSFSSNLELGRKAYPNSMALAVGQAIVSSQQAGHRTMARVIFFEDEDLNTVYILELHPTASKFQLQELITRRN